MSESPNKLIRFWQELKRRRVFSVVTAYAATAYIIIEVTNNIVSPLHLPVWIPTLVILLLIGGLPVAIILSWIFDFTPQGLKKTESFEEAEKEVVLTKPVKRKLRPSHVLNAVLIIAVIILAYPKIFKRDAMEKLRSSGERISVAVMPFQNMTGDTTKKFWQEMIQDNLITLLSNSEELKVRQTESINLLIQSKGLTNYASITPSFAGNISQKLDANIFIYGSIKEIGSTIRLNAQLTDSKTQDVFKSFQVDGATDEIMQIIDSLSAQVKDFLLISKLNKKVSPDIQHLASTKSPEAFTDFIYAQKAYSNGDSPTAIKFYLQAIATDSDFVYPYIKIFWAYQNQGLLTESKKWGSKVYAKRGLMTIPQKCLADVIYAVSYGTPNESVKYLRQALEYDDQLPDLITNLGNRYFELYQYDKAIPEFKKALEIYEKWGVKPFWSSNYTWLGFAYQKTGQYNKEKKLLKKAEKDFPDDPEIIRFQAILSLTEKDTVAANRYIEKYATIRREMSASEALINTDIAFIYSEGGILDKAEDYYRKALTFEPANPLRLNNLAYFLIDKDRNINEGMELADKALELNPDHYISLECKGWGLYKQGKNQEALELLQKSWNLRQRYRHSLFLHLEAAKKAVAGMK
jgi:tetratricopeptide (TPR) repeat protein